MRRSIFSAQPARTVSRALGNAQSTRRAFASSPVVSPIDPSKEQAHPIGPFYESILRTPSGAIPKVKPEEPPVTSQESPKAKPVEKPAAEPKSAPDAAEKSKPKPDAPTKPAPSKPAQENPVPAPAPPKTEPPKPEEKPSKSNTTTKSTKAAEETEKAPAPKKRSPKPKITAPLTNKSVPSSSTTLSSSTPAPPSSSSLSSPSPEDLSSSSSPSGPELQISSSLSSNQETTSSSNSSEIPQASASERARIVFGSSLAGPAERAERLARIRNESTLVAGVLVPPRPEEPDNCCMSGCVNCVWDRFRDDMEDWSSKTQEAERRLAAREVGESVGATQESIDAASGAADAVQSSDMSMDDDGGGSGANWDTGKKIAKDLWDEELYKNVPVGIREFMKQEKRLKEKHAREGTLGG